MTSITLSNNLTSIDKYVFCSCAFESIVIPDSVTTIGDYAFVACQNLSSITIPDSVTTIGDFAFNNCTGLTSITLSNNLTSIDKYVFCSCAFESIVIPDSVTTIDDYAFVACQNLSSITIPDSVTTIGDFAFNNCTALENLTLSNSLTSIGKETFAGCAVVSITIPDCVTSVGEYAFLACKALKSVVISNGVTTLGDFVFNNCPSIESITIPGSVTSIGEYAFNGCTNLNAVYISDLSAWLNIDFAEPSSNPLCYGAKLYLNGNEVTNLIIPYGVTEIKKSTFHGCSSITSVVIPGSVKKIGDYAFNKCLNWTDVYYSGTPEMWNSIEQGELWDRNGGTIYLTFIKMFGDVQASLGEDISLTYFIAKDFFEAVPRMRFTINGHSTVVNGIAVDNQYAYKFTGIAPQWMGDTITAEILADDDTVIETNEYSVLQYLHRLQTTSAEDLKYSTEKYNALQVLVRDLLVYGGAAQVFTGYKTSELVSNGITGSEFVTLAETDRNITDNGDIVTFNGMTVFFDNVNRLKFRFTADDLTGVTFKVTAGGRETNFTLTQDGEYYIITTEGIKAVGFDNAYTVTAYKDNSPGASATYSVKSYVFAKQGELTNVALLAKATYNYGLSAKAFALAK